MFAATILVEAPPRSLSTSSVQQKHYLLTFQFFGMKCPFFYF
jgi:hypothetical protein